MIANDEIHIQTIGNLNSLQRTNKLKGTAMQKLLLTSIPNKKEDKSIKHIIDSVHNKVHQYYYINTPFKVNNSLIFKSEKEIINLSELPEYCHIYLREQIKNKKWKVCSNCGQYILAEKQNTRKCLKCKKGFFRFNVKTYNDWKGCFSGNRTETLNWLESEKIISKIPFIKKRIDFFRFKKGVFYVFECKNKECSGLAFRDFCSAIMYPIILKDLGEDVSSLEIVYNGDINPDLQSVIEKGIHNKYAFAVRFVPIKNYLKAEGINIERVNVVKGDGGWTYDIVNGNTDNLKICIGGEL